MTRPEPAAQDTAARIAARGFLPVLAPMLRIVALPPAPLPPVDAVLLTSRNALPALPAALHALPLLAVGAATAEAARAQGFTCVTSADADAAALAIVAAERLPGRTFLLPTARGQGHALAAALREAGCRVHRRVTYEARPVRALPAAARQSLRERRIGSALFFSAETARAFASAVTRAGLNTAARDVTACAISPGVGMALETLPWRRIRVAPRPTQDALLTLIE